MMYALVELSHGTILRRFESRDEALGALERVLDVPAGTDADDDPAAPRDFAVVEFDDQGRLAGDPIAPERLVLFS